MSMYINEHVPKTINLIKNITKWDTPEFLEAEEMGKVSQMLQPLLKLQCLQYLHTTHHQEGAGQAAAVGAGHEG